MFLSRPTRKIAELRSAWVGKPFTARPCSWWGLPCRPVAGNAVGSYPAFSPLPRKTRRFLGSGIFSVVLSVEDPFRSLLPAINRHHFRRSPDFPRRTGPVL